MVLTEQQRRYLALMDIPVWERRILAPAFNGGVVSDSAPVLDAPVPLEIEADERSEPALDREMEWTALQRQVQQCTACALSDTRTQTVFGVGNRRAQWMLIGEAPGEDEDKQGEPFVGRAGKLLNEMLFAIGLAREDVYIANILKCRPPGNRNPAPDEAAACEHFLIKQIDLVQPKLILSIGGVAAKNLLKNDEAVGRLRNKVHYFGAQRIPLIVTYHPAYLLRSPLEKRKAWDDLLFAKRVMQGLNEAPRE